MMSSRPVGHLGKARGDTPQPTPPPPPTLGSLRLRNRSSPASAQRSFMLIARVLVVKAVLVDPILGFSVNSPPILSFLFLWLDILVEPRSASAARECSALRFEASASQTSNLCGVLKIKAHGSRSGFAVQSIDPLCFDDCHRSHKEPGIQCNELGILWEVHANKRDTESNSLLMRCARLLRPLLSKTTESG